MKNLIIIVGIVLIILGIVALGYQGFTYTKTEKVAEIGDFQVTANTEKTVYFPPIVGGAALVVGVILVIVGRNKKGP